MNEVRTSGPLSFTEPDCPTRVGERINTLNEIYDIPMPRLGMRVFVKDEGLSYIITGLKDKTIEGVVVPDAQVDKYESIGAKDIAWDSSSNLNDFINAGVYNIKGTRQNAADNLPITNTGADATIAARLIVTVTPEGATTYRHSIGQTLILSNAEGKETKIYTRNGNRTSYDGGISYTIEWGAWATQQTNVNVGQVDNLDNLKDNGIYSGVWTKGSYDSYPLTFVCIVINDYFVGVSPRRISQFVYGLSKMDGSTVYQSRVWDDSKSAWGDWEILNKKEISSMISMEIAKVVADAPEAFDTLKEIAEWIRTHGADAREMLASIQALATDIDNERTARTKDVSDIKKYALQYDTLGFSPTADKLSIYGKTLDGQGTLGVDIPAATTEKTGVMTAADKVKLNDNTTAINTEKNNRETADASIKASSVGVTSFTASTTATTVAVNSKSIDNTKTGSVTIPAATQTTAGVMTAEDKKAVDGIAAAVEEGRKAALRALYIAAGAKYNNITGLYSLNGVDDLTEEQMQICYDNKDLCTNLNWGNIARYMTQLRTIYPFPQRTTNLNVSQTTNGWSWNSSYTFMDCVDLEVFRICQNAPLDTTSTSDMLSATRLHWTFYDCVDLHTVYPINVENVTSFPNTFYKCKSLVNLRLYGVKCNLSLAHSPLISKESLLYIVNNSLASDRITITLHADAYATLAEETDIISALDAKPLVNLVSA